MSAEDADARRRQWGVQPDGPRGTVSATDIEIAAQLHVQGGGDELDFYRRFAQEGEAALDATKIAERRDWLQRTADERARREFEESPEGRRLKAAQLADEQAARKVLADRARLLLLEEREFPADDVAALPDEEAIVAARVEPAGPDPLTDVALNVRAATSSEGGDK